MRAFDPTVSDYTKALSQGQSPRAIATARSRADVAYGRLERFERILAAVRTANALADITRWIPVQVAPQPVRQPMPKQQPVQVAPALQTLREHFEGRRHR